MGDRVKIQRLACVRVSRLRLGVRKVKKVTKTVTKSSKGDGETTVETVTKMTSSSEASGRDGDMTYNVSNGEVSGDNMVNGSLDWKDNSDRDLEYEILFCHHCDDSLAGHRYV